MPSAAAARGGVKYCANLHDGGKMAAGRENERRRKKGNYGSRENRDRHGAQYESGVANFPRN